jgi:hypothetical protein
MVDDGSDKVVFKIDWFKLVHQFKPKPRLAHHFLTLSNVKIVIFNAVPCQPSSQK